MHDTVIVGGGLCGLSLADSLCGMGRSFALYEARNRLGGRILSVQCGSIRLDLGPTWYWPDMQPRMARLVSDLGLESFPQHDIGTVRHLSDAEKEPVTVRLADVHGGARRISGGMAAMVDALARRLPQESIRMERELVSVCSRETHVELLFRSFGVNEIVRAKRAVLAIPPRLLEEKVDFAPGLDTKVRDAMRATHTWMAGQAKAVVGYEAPFWRQAGESGNAFVSHSQAVLGEIFDACDAGGQHAALGGFFALQPGYRASVHPESMTMLISSQLVQVFGLEAECGEQRMQDWASEPFTCSALDLEPPEGHPEYGDANLCLPLWGNRLFLAGSETAGYGGGYMEGALEAAARVSQMLLLCA